MTETTHSPAPTTRPRRVIAVTAAGTLLAGLLVTGGVVAGRASVDDTLTTSSAAISTSARDPGTTAGPDTQTAPDHVPDYVPDDAPDDGAATEGSAFGSIAALGEGDFVLIAPSGGTLSVRTTEDTVLDPALGESVADLSEGLMVLVTGSQDSDGTVTATRVTAIPDPTGGTAVPDGTDDATEPATPGEAV